MQTKLETIPEDEVWQVNGKDEEGNMIIEHIPMKECKDYVNRNVMKEVKRLELKEKQNRDYLTMGDKMPDKIKRFLRKI